MKRRAVLLGWLIVSITMGLSLRAQAASSISSFDVTATVLKDKSVHIQEKIAYDFGDVVDDFGIIRNIPLGGQNLPQLTIRILGVTDDQGTPLAYVVTTANNALGIVIGDKNVFVRGVHTYVIDYLVQNIMGVANGLDTLGWNITGSGWGMPIKHSSAVFILPEALAPNLIEATCFTGSNGSYEQACTKQIEAGTSTTAIRFSVTRLLDIGEGWTVYLKIHPPVLAGQTPVHLGFVWLVVAVLIVLIFIFRKPARALLMKGVSRAKRHRSR
ncbi:MAG TPA: DUF2207 domain-containing protein [Candidatus Paceibacterota bacterium]|nr:DUF2207 domain-containing protein [Candidatus Paceibacterota bacterium]